MNYFRRYAIFMKLPINYFVLPKKQKTEDKQFTVVNVCFVHTS